MRALSPRIARELGRSPDSPKAGEDLFALGRQRLAELSECSSTGPERRLPRGVARELEGLRIIERVLAGDQPG